jgi:hypothetical protein
MIMPLAKVDPLLNLAPCRQPNCNNNSKRRVQGWCAMHWMRLQKGSPAMDAPSRNYWVPYVSSRICKTDGCDRLVQNSGYCGRHYKALRKSGSLEPAENKVCALDGQDANRSGVCNRHYDIFRSFGWKGITALLVYSVEGCAICGNKDRQPHIDHNHLCCGPTTGKGAKRRTCGKCIRAALCSQCNVGIGYFSESVEKMHQAIAYLQKWEVK